MGSQREPVEPPEPTEADWVQAMEECEARILGETVAFRAYEIAAERSLEAGS